MAFSDSIFPLIFPCQSQHVTWQPNQPSVATTPTDTM